MDSNLLPDALQALEQCHSSDQLQAFHATYLGKSGLIAAQYKTLKDLSPEEKKTAGQQIQELHTTIEKAFFTKQDAVKQAERDTQMASEMIDRSFPPLHLDQGSLSLLTKMRRHVEEVFRSMGFHIDYGHHVVTQWENFQSVNIPPTHPATEMHDTLYLQDKDEEGKQLVLRTHTSAHQVELIKQYGVPCKFVIPGKVYRNEKMDASHDCVFRQLEGVLIDEGISIGHFKSIMQTILEALLEQTGIEMRMRPAYFPFVEPGFEIDAHYQLGKKSQRVELL